MPIFYISYKKRNWKLLTYASPVLPPYIIEIGIIFFTKESSKKDLKWFLILLII